MTESVQSMSKPLLTPVELDQLSCPQAMRIDVRFPNGTEYVLAFDADARPLRRLVEDAALGVRTYELLSIKRPGDLLHYVWLTVSPYNISPSDYFLGDSEIQYLRKALEKSDSIRFKEFNRAFCFMGDDTPRGYYYWLDFCVGTAWTSYLHGLMTLVATAQSALRAWDDFLVQRQVRLMEQGRHYCDYSPDIYRDSALESNHKEDEPISPELRDLILELARRPDIRSVSCPFQDLALWRGLIAEQVRRADAQGLRPEDAFHISGPDSGIPHLNTNVVRGDLECGGEVHIPYEGAAPGHLFVQPKWRGIDPNRAKTAPTLGEAVYATYADDEKLTCRYWLTRFKELGEIPSACRIEVAGWVLYIHPNASALDEITVRTLAEAMKVSH